MSKRTIAILVVAGLLVSVWILALVIPHSAVRTEPNPPLNASGWRSAAGFTFMNREDVPARDCRFTIRDSSGDSWGARLEQDVAPMQRVEIRWRDFTAAGQPMPVEYSQRGIVAICDVAGKDLSAGFGR